MIGVVCHVEAQAIVHLTPQESGDCGGYSAVLLVKKISCLPLTVGVVDSGHGANLDPRHPLETDVKGPP